VETGIVVDVNRVGVLRVRVRWTDGNETNVKASSLTRL
jgi:hypothetical protein